MQSSNLPPALNKILSSKLECLWKKYANIFESIKNTEKHVRTVEEKVNMLAVSECYTADDALTLAVEMDELLETMTKCHTVLSGPSRVNRSVDILKKVATEQGQTSHTDDSAFAINLADSKSIDNNASTISMLKIQMEFLQQQISDLHDLHNIRLPELETKVKILEEDHSLKNNLAEKCLLLQDIQLRDNQSVQNIARKFSRMETDIVSLKDDLKQLDTHQKGLGEKIDEVKSTTDSLVSLRGILNDLHMNVAKREDLTHNFNQLEEELTTFKCLLSPLLGQVTEDNPGGDDHKIANPVFVAQIRELLRVKPNQPICCQTVWQENNGYDTDTGTFTAPVAGLYFFSVSMSTCSEGVFCVSIMNNGNQAAKCGTTGREDEQTCTSVFLRLSLGDKVWIEAERHTTPGITVGGGFSNFIGCCLK